MTHTESVARSIAKAQHGTDAFWPNYGRAARAATEELAKLAASTENPEVAILLARANNQH